MRRAHFVALAFLLGLSGCGSPAIPTGENLGTVTGLVFDAATNQGIAGVTVSAFVVNTTTTGSDGRYTLSNVPAGVGEVQVVAPSGYSAQGGGTFPIDLQPGENYTLNIPLTKTN
jgi:hypothetical protein